MKLPRINPTTTSAWKALESHFQTLQADRIAELFAQDPSRVVKYTTHWQEFTLDYSKTGWTIRPKNCCSSWRNNVN